MHKIALFERDMPKMEPKPIGYDWRRLPISLGPCAAARSQVPSRPSLARVPRRALEGGMCSVGTNGAQIGLAA